MTVIERLNAKKDELEERLNGQSNWGSQRKETLQYKVRKIEELIVAYQATSSPINLSETKKILDQQVGFEEQKRKIIESLEIEEFRAQRNIKKEPQILCFVGPVGVGKTTFSQLLAQALKKKFFSVALGGLSDTSILVGASENSSGTEIGQLAKSLAETKTCDPLILLDEIDKSGSGFKNCLTNVLDPTQNQGILDYYLDIKLDLSQVTFIVTANDLKKIPEHLRSRMLIIELPGYTIEKKKEIANKFIENWFTQNGSLNKNNKILFSPFNFESVAYLDNN